MLHFVYHVTCLFIFLKTHLKKKDNKATTSKMFNSLILLLELTKKYILKFTYTGCLEINDNSFAQDQNRLNSEEKFSTILQLLQRG